MLYLMLLLVNGTLIITGFIVYLDHKQSLTKPIQAVIGLIGILFSWVTYSYLGFPGDDFQSMFFCFGILSLL